ncbi:MAG: dephospho-CoA kinase [Bacteroidetes bacterium]|nr:dephospho-CoA kinase [Bacteroidota bacterium]
MKQIGITGNIGSGKTTAARIFAALGIPVYDADSRAKAVMTENKLLKEQLTQHFGAETYQLDGSINRNYLANLVFNHQPNLELLNGIVHPAVFADYEIWIEAQKAPYVLKEAALLYESGSYKKLDKIILVTCPQEIRLQRSMARDGVTKEAILARMAKQISEEEKLLRANFIIKNDGLHLLIPQVMELHKKILQLQ